MQKLCEIEEKLKKEHIDIKSRYCDNIDGLNKYKQQTMNNLQFYSCARSQHAHAIRMNWLNIITPPSLISAYPSSPFHRVTSNNQSPKEY